MPFRLKSKDQEDLFKDALSLANAYKLPSAQTDHSKTPQMRNAFGQKEKRKSGLGSLFWQFRSYERGDNPKAIDWKRTARGDQLIVKERTHEQSDTYRFWIDPSLRQDDLKFDDALIYSLALSHLFHDTEDRTSVISFDKTIPKRGLKTLREHMQFFQSYDQISFHDLRKVDLPKSHTPVLFSDYWRDLEFIEKSLSQLWTKNRKGFLVQIAKSEELNFPFLGRTFFQNNLESNDVYRIEDASAVRDAYLQKINDHQLKLQNLTQKYGWKLITLSDENSRDENLHIMLQTIFDTGQA